MAIGFEHPEHECLAQQLGLELDRRGNIRTRGQSIARPGRSGVSRHQQVGDRF